MNPYIHVGNLQVASGLHRFLESEVLPGTGLSADKFWGQLELLIDELTPVNQALLHKRDELQGLLNQWHKQHRDDFDAETYKAYLYQIGYLEPEAEDFQITTQNVDEEIAKQSGPQLVVPVNNARYALNAANSRWGSLYDALYGTDVIDDSDGAERGASYNAARGLKVIAYGKSFLDQAAPLTKNSHAEVVAYSVADGQLQIVLTNGEVVGLQESALFVGYQGSPSSPAAVLLSNNGLHIEIQIDRHHRIGQNDPAGVKDILLEAAITTIMDCEDSVAAVDAEDKVDVYRNWLGLMKGTLQASFQKGDATVTRALHSDRSYVSAEGKAFELPGRSLLFVRNVGHLMTIDAILDRNGNDVPEGILDAVVTSAIAMHDVIGNSLYRNSNKGSIYIVKPKMHGSEEVAFANTLFNRVEDLLGLERHTIKIGVMDEERRTSLNLKACIREVKDRIVFINTGFLDRTGDEMHTSMEAGPMIRKNQMKSSTWLQGYERSNVHVGLTCGLQGKAQIGKGMWAMPDLMKEMLKQKNSQLEAGCTTAWVPSPTAATLHALHYHQVDVKEVQAQLLKHSASYIDQILEIPVSPDASWSQEEIQQELDNNAQGILGYVVRWVEQGIGCSKVPDINNIGLMEDRATLRISSQHLANWLHHGICSEEQVIETMRRMASIVDNQNANDPAYRSMSADYERSAAFQAALELVLQGYDQPNGYTEPILHRYRRAFKTSGAALKA
ncbi:malate synthase G [Paenibacillus aestuarii]|uniref:Malate synthase G n=1 Tax=Paenibacillus aestuarii TaxID=516965 RepID=A0ABW0K936_9BACL|nr:malate synthase G [Paenibacillus aestuarii]